MFHKYLKILAIFFVGFHDIGSANAKLGFDPDSCVLADREASPEEVKSAYSDMPKSKKYSIDPAKFAKIYRALLYAKSGNLRNLSALRLSKSEINEQIKIDDSATLLAWSARCGRLSIVKYLISRGANVNMRFDYIYPAGIFHSRSTAAIWGVSGENPKVIAELHRHGANFFLAEDMYPVGSPEKKISFNATNVPD